MQEAQVTIGKVLKPFGLHGEVKVFPLTDMLERFECLDDVAIRTKQGEELCCRVLKVRLRPPFVYLVFEGFSSREDIEKIRSGLIQIPESERITLPEGEYFQSDLIGLEVYQLGGAYLGSIVDVIETGVNDLFVVKDGSREVLIPALWRIVKGINLEQNRMEVDPPEGLLDL